MDEIDSKALEKITIQEYISQFDPEIRDILYNAYGKYLEGSPRDMALFLEVLLSLRNPRTQKILLMRLGVVTGSPMTPEEVAQALRITRQRVCQIENMAIRRLGAYVHRRNKASGSPEA